MRFTATILLFLFTFEAVVNAQVINPKAEIVSSSEKIVKGAPFSAEAVSESVQILFDGNKIVQSAKTRLYRDSEGRFRRDEMPKPVGMFVDVPQTIFIFDPVANLKFYLNPEKKTARQTSFKYEKAEKPKPVEEKEWKTKADQQEIKKDEQEIEKDEQEYQKDRQELEKRRQELEKRRQQSGTEETEKEWAQLERLGQQLDARKAKLESRKQQLKDRKERKESRQKNKPDEWVPKEKQSEVQVTRSETNESSSSVSNSSENSQTQDDKPTEIVKKENVSKPAKNADYANQPDNPALPSLPKGEVKNESLGTRKFDDTEAEGTRLTMTLPAGAIGNERPIEIVYERWYSKELQMIVFSEYRDPRFGEQTYRLINIKRGEPDGALFTLPADYQLVNEPEIKIKPPIKRTPVPKKGSTFI